MVTNIPNEEVLKNTFEKLQNWMRGEENKSIDEWLENDHESYESFNWLMKHCAANGWTSPEINMLDHADEEGKSVAKTLWKSAMNFAKGERND